MAVSLKDLENQVRSLNRLYKFPGRKYVGQTKTKPRRLKYKGKGFELEQSYGRVRLAFNSAKGGYRNISPNLTKKDLYLYMSAMYEGVYRYKNRSKLK